MILGRWEILRKRATRTKKGLNDRCRRCNKVIVDGELYAAVKRSFITKGNKRGWSTKRFHQDCVKSWSDHMFDYVESRWEVSRKEHHPHTGRPVHLSITPEQTKERRRLLVRRSYLVNRIYFLRAEIRNTDLENEKRLVKLWKTLEKIYDELPGLDASVNAIAPFTPVENPIRTRKATDDKQDEQRRPIANKKIRELEGRRDHSFPLTPEQWEEQEAKNQAINDIIEATKARLDLDRRNLWDFGTDSPRNNFR